MTRARALTRRSLRLAPRRRPGSGAGPASLAALAGMIGLLSACVSFPDAPAPTAAPAIGDNFVRVADGARLALDVWRPAGEARTVVVALHGMNDYANAWALPAARWAEAGIATYAYDQRGFGRIRDSGAADRDEANAVNARGRWPGTPALIADLRAVLAAVREEHPGAPLFVAGHSMGGAVVLAAMDEAPLPVDGVVLAAPAVWGGSRLPLLYRVSLNFAAMLAPGKTLTGERAKRMPSDNIEVLRAMAADPNMIVDTRLDAVLGLVRLMGRAWDASDDAGGRILFLMGGKDEIIPPDALEAAAARLCGAVDTRAYEDGWHLLFRDLAGPRFAADAAEWMVSPPHTDGPAAGPAEIACAGAAPPQGP